MKSLVNFDLADPYYSTSEIIDCIISVDLLGSPSHDLINESKEAKNILRPSKKLFCCINIYIFLKIYLIFQVHQNWLLFLRCCQLLFLEELQPCRLGKKYNLIWAQNGQYPRAPQSDFISLCMYIPLALVMIRTVLKIITRDGAARVLVQINEINMSNCIRENVNCFFN